MRFNYWIGKIKEAEKFIVLRTIRCSWTLESQQDLRTQHNLDAEAELATIMAKEIRQQLDREILGDLKEFVEFREEKKAQGNFWLKQCETKITFDKITLPQFTDEAQERMNDAMITYRLVRAPVKGTYDK